jgi:hypothetical protein
LQVVVAVVDYGRAVVVQVDTGQAQLKQLPLVSLIQ